MWEWQLSILNECSKTYWFKRSFNIFYSPLISYLIEYSKRNMELRFSHSSKAFRALRANGKKNNSLKQCKTNDINITDVFSRLNMGFLLKPLQEQHDINLTDSDQLTNAPQNSKQSWHRIKNYWSPMKPLVDTRHRSSYPEVFCKIGDLKYLAKFTGKHLFSENISCGCFCWH